MIIGKAAPTGDCCQIVGHIRFVVHAAGPTVPVKASSGAEGSVEQPPRVIFIRVNMAVIGLLHLFMLLACTYPAASATGFYVVECQSDPAL
tara:strand:+ start:278 stop:550 length:273 start_codon:yes stop_codon:yes gene_type:complete